MVDGATEAFEADIQSDLESEGEPDSDEETEESALARRVRSMCEDNLKQFLRKAKGMSAAAAKDFISTRISINVDDEIVYDEKGLRTVTVYSEIKPTKKYKKDGSDASGIRLEHKYHHRVRWYEYKVRWCDIEHYAGLCYTMGGVSGDFFESHFSQVPRARHKSIEKRMFRMSQKKAKMIRDNVFGDDWSPLEAILMCYAAAGVNYKDSNTDISSDAKKPSCKSHWLEHHTRKVCKALSEEDDGYETESFAKRLQVEREKFEKENIEKENAFEKVSWEYDTSELPTYTW